MFKKFVASLLVTMTLGTPALGAGWDPSDKQEVFNILMEQAMVNPDWEDYTGAEASKIINCLNDYYESIMDYKSYRWKLATTASFEDKRDLSNVITACHNQVTNPKYF